jgi:hypothetical protein
MDGNFQIDEREQVYIPLSDETLRKLDEMVELTGLTEDELVSMLLYKFKRELNRYDNENFPDDTFPEAFPPVASVPTQCAPEPASEPLGAI